MFAAGSGAHRIWTRPIAKRAGVDTARNVPGGGRAVNRSDLLYGRGMPRQLAVRLAARLAEVEGVVAVALGGSTARPDGDEPRSEEHTSELQSHHDLVC